jgi:simple sugar transport system permease protein
MTEVIQYATPLALAALGEIINQKAGQMNIGLEGMMLASAFFAMLATLATGLPLLGLLAGVCAALILALVSSWFTVQLSADQVVVGTALNLLCLGLTNTLFRARFGQIGQLLSLPKLASVAGFDLVMLFAILSIGMIWFLINRTAWGLATRAAGEYPKAAEAAGFSVKKLRITACLVAGAYAGLAGAYLTLGVTGSFAENMTAGRGFMAIAMVTFGRWNSLWVVAACLLVGYCESLQYTLQLRSSEIPFQLFTALPYLVALVVLLSVGPASAGPRALGVPYRTEK